MLVRTENIDGNIDALNKHILQQEVEEFEAESLLQARVDKASDIEHDLLFEIDTRDFIDQMIDEYPDLLESAIINLIYASKKDELLDGTSSQKKLKKLAYLLQDKMSDWALDEAVYSIK